MRKLDIVSELLNRGLVKGSRRYKTAYLDLWRERNERKIEAYRRTFKERKRARYQADPLFRKNLQRKWRAYYRRKLKEDPAWSSKRISAWRKLNPEKWRLLMKRASIRGLHRRWYQRHRTEKLRKRREYDLRKNPIHGLKRLIADVRAGRRAPEDLIAEYRRAFAQVYEGSDGKAGKSKDGKRGLPMR
jgi:hypothetical protein